jgi:hypothetical protein
MYNNEEEIKSGVKRDRTKQWTKIVTKIINFNAANTIITLNLMLWIKNN